MRLRDESQGEQFFEENWIILQNLVIPFTTQLEAKRQFVQFQQILSGCGFFMVLLATPALSRMWLHLGGLQALVRRSWGIMLPQMALLFALASAVAGLTIDAVQVALYATPQGSDSLTTLAVASIMVVTTVLIAVIMALRWGSYHLTYTLSAALLVPWTLILLITGSVIVAQSEVAPAYVKEHWSELQNFVGPKFAAGGPNKYAQAAALRMEQAGTLALVTGMTALVYIFTGLRSACWALTLGPNSLEAAMAPASDSALASLGDSWQGKGGYGSVGGGEAAAPAATSSAPPRTSDGESLASYQGQKLAELDAEGGHMEGVEIDAESVTSEAAGANDTFEGVETPHLGPRQPPGEEDGTPPLSRSTLDGSTRRTSVNTFRYAKHSSVFATAQPASAGDWCQATTAQSLHTLRMEWKCFAVVGAIFVVVLGALGGGMYQLQADALCGALSRDGEAPHHVSFSARVPVQLFPTLNIINKYPLGTVQVFWDLDVTDGMANITVEQWAVEQQHMLTQEKFDRALTSIVDEEGGDDFFADHNTYYTYNLDMSPAAQNTTYGAAKADCVATAVIITMPALTLQTTMRVTGDHVFTNLTGTLDTSTFQSYLRAALVTSVDGPILVQNFFSNLQDPIFNTPPPATRALNLTSLTGDIHAELVLSENGADLETGGNIHTALLMGGHIQLPAGINLHGDVSLLCHGAGRIAATGIMTGSNYYMQTFVGDIIIDQGEGFVLNNVDIRSTWGHVYLNSMLFLAANQTTVRTRAGVSGAAVYGNYLDVQTDFGEISLAEVFIGLDTPEDTTNKGLFPPSDITAPYREPGVFLASNYGKLTLIGLGGGLLASSEPGTLPFAKRMGLTLETVHSDIRVQVNGGGYTGPYQISTEDGEVVVELEGIQGPSSGYLGTPSLKPGEASVGHLNITSTNGDVDFSLMVNPMGDLGGLF